MNALMELFDRGGPAMVAIVCLAVVLYGFCFQMLFDLRELRRGTIRHAPADSFQLNQWRQEAHELQENFRQDRVVLGAMIAAAPLLGLLGTVSGMARTFENLSSQMGQKSMEGLAGGISEVLICTESGLAVALPALLLVHIAHRQMRRQLQQLNRFENEADSAIAE